MICDNFILPHIRQSVIILFLYPGNIIRIPALIIPIPTGIKMIVQQKITPTPDRMRPMGNRISSHTQAFKIAPVILYAIPNKMVNSNRHNINEIIIFLLSIM